MADFVHLEWGRNACSDGYAATVDFSNFHLKA
ncbi:hypothetical protein PsAD26_05626 [Pseudovibrio sp. Ad26]|nr:hypothetical protein PsAD26_05626 [Pseudovibrio sp. Ad26]